METKNAMQKTSQASIRNSLGAPRKIPDQVRSAMEHSFRTDFSDVKLYESPILREHGAHAAASGREIAFAPGELDFSSENGKKVLGHELSHVVSQSKGEVRGKGVINDTSLEHQADLEGERAARFQDPMPSENTGMTPLGNGITSEMPTQCKKMKGHGSGPFSFLTPWRNIGFSKFASQRAADLEIEDSEATAFDEDPVDTSDDRIRRDYVAEYNRLHSDPYAEPIYAKNHIVTSKDDKVRDADLDAKMDFKERINDAAPKDYAKQRKAALKEALASDSVDKDAEKRLTENGYTKKDTSAPLYFFAKLVAKHFVKKSIKDNFALASYVNSADGKEHKVGASSRGKKGLITYKDAKKNAKHYLKNYKKIHDEIDNVSLI